MKRMESAVDFKPNEASETKSNYWSFILQMLVVAAGTYCLYKITESRKIIINHYHLPKPTGDVPSTHVCENFNQNSVV
jgi:hypothetical protein